MKDAFLRARLRPRHARPAAAARAAAVESRIAGDRCDAGNGRHPGVGRGPISLPSTISLSWYAERVKGAADVKPPKLTAGERWKLTVRLKRTRGLSNPHTFDFEPWALERGIRATGYVRTKAGIERLAERVDGWPDTLHRWRGQI